MRNEKSFWLSVIIPCYNEGSTIEDVIEAVKKQPFFKQIIVVDDGSSDATPNILKNIKGDEKNEILILRHKKNLGKVVAIKTGLKHVKGKY
jgi:glycosyltransferase involved in cell wall biosynthesis